MKILSHDKRKIKKYIKLSLKKSIKTFNSITNKNGKNIILPFLEEDKKCLRYNQFKITYYNYNYFYYQSKQKSYFMKYQRQNYENMQ